MLPVVEIFYSLQGEGRYIGHPSLFIRLAGCNMTCPGLPCDTVRAVDAKSFADGWVRYDTATNLISAVYDAIDSKTKTVPKHIVITGGEPTIHFANPVFLELAKHFVESDFLITVETNATVALDFEANPILGNFIFSMSVKLSNSGEAYAKRIKLDVIEMYTKSSKSSFLKFVLDENMINSTAFEEIDSIIKHLPCKPDIYCMPKASKKAELDLTTKAVFDFCMLHGFIYSDRIHIRAYDDKDGI